MTLAREVMESTDVGDIFIITAEIILSLTGRYSTTFNDYFHVRNYLLFKHFRKDY